MVSHVNITAKPKPHGVNNMKRILRFTAPWCQPCKVMAKTLEEINSGVPVEVVDIDVHSDLAVEYGIRSVPTLVMKDGNIEVKRMTGVKSKQQLAEWING
jgi:thioredoxin-like negative regulator of GroEL